MQKKNEPQNNIVLRLSCGFSSLAEPDLFWLFQYRLFSFFPELLLGEDVVNFINQIMKWIRIFVPILLIGLGILDFTKATFSKSEDDMKKSREKFIKRIVAAVLVFLAPIFINLILELANSVWSWISPETCIK